MTTDKLFQIDATQPTEEEQRKAERGRELMRAAEEWRKLNPRMFSWLEEQVLDAAHNGRMTSVRELCERIRWADNVDEEGNPVHISNSLTACFARMLVEKHPETAKHIIMRKSVLDEA